MDRKYEYCKHGTALIHDFCEWCAGEELSSESIKQAALNATNELLKKSGMPQIHQNGNGEHDHIAVSESLANGYGLKHVSYATNGMVWVNRTALDLAKEAIKRKESIEPRMPRAKQ